MNGNEDDTVLILHELRRLLGAVNCLAVVVVLCTLAIIMALGRSELLVVVLALLGVVLVVCVLGALTGTAAGKAIRWVRR